MIPTNTNHNPRIRPRPRSGVSAIARQDTSFSEYILFPPNTNTPQQNPFIFHSGIPLPNPVLNTVPTTSSSFQFSFPLMQPEEEGQIQEEEKEERIETKRDTAFDMTIVETEEYKKKKRIQKLAKSIETYLEEKPDETTYCLSRYTLFEIDGIQADVYIGKEEESYYYHLISKNIEYVEDDSIEEDTDFMLLEKNDFDTVVDVLEHIEKVRDTYTFLDFYLLSPEKKEIARNHRAFLPISQDKICSVCYEPTLEYTTCKHPICLKCREKCIVNERKMCPVCRSSQLRLYPTELAKL
jgi:hypothetical protein